MIKPSLENRAQALNGAAKTIASLQQSLSEHKRTLLKCEMALNFFKSELAIICGGRKKTNVLDALLFDAQRALKAIAELKTNEKRDV